MVFQLLDTVLNNAFIFCHSPDLGEFQWRFQTGPAHMVFIKTVMKPDATGGAKGRGYGIKTGFHAIFTETGFKSLRMVSGFTQIDPAFQTFFGEKQYLKHPSEGSLDFTGG
jgi:hypothetical protein